MGAKTQLLGALTLIMLCGNQCKTTAQPKPKPKPAPDLRALAERSIVAIHGKFREQDLLGQDTGEWYGTGIIIGRTGKNYQVLANVHDLGVWQIDAKELSIPDIVEYKITVILPNGQNVEPARVRVSSNHIDFAILDITSADELHPLSLQQSCPAKDTTIYVYKHNAVFQVERSKGEVSFVQKISPAKGGWYSEIITTSRRMEGDGGLMVDDDGRLIGLTTHPEARHTAYQKGSSIAICSESIYRNLEQRKLIDFPAAAPDKLGGFIRSHVNSFR